jgi:hypothetical protein
MDSRTPAFPPAAYAPAPWGDANTRGLAFAAIADWRQAAAAFADAASVLSHEALHDGGHGAPSDALALVLSNLAHACARDGRREEAIDHAHRALAVREALAGTASPLAARTRMDLAVLLASAGALGEARTLLDTARTQLETTFGTGDVRLLGVLENSARLALMTGELERAATDVRRLRGVMELHEAPMDRLTSLTDRLHVAGVSVEGALPAAMAETHPWMPAETPIDALADAPADARVEEWTSEPVDPMPMADAPPLDPMVEDGTEPLPWLAADAGALELPAPWVPETSAELLWDAPDESLGDGPLPDGDPFGSLLSDAEPRPLVGSEDVPSLDAFDAGDASTGPLGLASLLDDGEGGWPSGGAEPAGLGAPPVAAPTLSPMGSLVEDRWGAMAADETAADAADSLWSTLLEEETPGAAGAPAEAPLAWELPQELPRELRQVEVALDAEEAWLPRTVEATHAAPAPLPQDDDIPWLDAGGTASEPEAMTAGMGAAWGEDDGPGTGAPFGGLTAGRLLDEPEPEIPDFLRMHPASAGSGQAAEATPPSIPVTPADDADAWEEEEAFAGGGVAIGTQGGGRPQAGLLPLVPEGARWGATGAATPHEGTVAIHPSPVNKYDEILQRVRKQALGNRASHPGTNPSSGRVLVLSVVTVAALGVGGGLWYTLLR